MSAWPTSYTARATSVRHFPGRIRRQTWKSFLLPGKFLQPVAVAGVEDLGHDVRGARVTVNAGGGGTVAGPALDVGPRGKSEIFNVPCPQPVSQQPDVINPGQWVPAAAVCCWQLLHLDQSLTVALLLRVRSQENEDLVHPEYVQAGCLAVGPSVSIFQSVQGYGFVNSAGQPVGG